jgi:uncharacterized protein YceH (UPF0502 family)
MNEPAEKNAVRTLSRVQRRVLGTLIEKGLTTPDQYPLTLKSTTSGCNQKSNRAPTSNYSEDDVLDALEALRELGLVAEVFTDGGRSARYRHYTRVHYDFSETQLAIITELLLRGRQQLGELRSRASRMARIENQSALKEDLRALQDMGFIQADGPLDRRGVEVDHTFYLEGENMRMTASSVEEPTAAANMSHEATTAPNATPPQAAAPGLNETIGDLEQKIEELQQAFEALNRRVEQLETMWNG